MYLFFFARKTHICFYCKTEIKRSEAFVKHSFRGRNTQGELGLLFHIDCYHKWWDEFFVKRFLDWKLSKTPPKRMGRPLKYTTPYSVTQRLRCLLNYHKRLGHNEQVEELRNKLTECEIKHE